MQRLSGLFIFVTIFAFLFIFVFVIVLYLLYWGRVTPVAQLWVPFHPAEPLSLSPQVPTSYLALVGKSTTQLAGGDKS